MTFHNSYDDTVRAAAYARLAFPGTYSLAFRDLPKLIDLNVKGTAALDFGCGTGRSSRFLRARGFDVVGVDISKAMVSQAHLLDPTGTYLCLEDGDFQAISGRRFDLILSAFTFDNIVHEKKGMLFSHLMRLLAKDGIFINLVSSPDLYTHEWASFTTEEFPENAQANSGDVVRIVTKDFDDGRPCEDILCTEQDYRTFYAAAGFQVITAHRPVARGDEPYEWVTETRLSPWRLDVLGKVPMKS